MHQKQAISVFWFRRDLRLTDNVGLYHALQNELPVLPLFIFDTNIISELPQNDPRVNFIYDSLLKIQSELRDHGSGLIVKKGDPLAVWKNLAKTYHIALIFTNRDYEPYAIQRDGLVQTWAETKGIEFNTFKDQVILEPGEVLKDDGKPYTVYTPFKNKWLVRYKELVHPIKTYNPSLGNVVKFTQDFPTKNELNITGSSIGVPPLDLSVVPTYKDTRNFPSVHGTSRIGPHLRFGTLGIRSLVKQVVKQEGTYLSELIWREFFMQILHYFPRVVNENFKTKYNAVPWRNNQEEFNAWCSGTTGYPMVDAGMRELNSTGYMHNRVRMITAGFLCKHLLIDWRWGEAYFAKKLLDYELAANNGNWQWAAGTGCDAAPYFRVFNPTTQIQKFDKQLEYINTWVPELNTLQYPNPIVEHKFARERAISTYKEALNTIA